MTDEKKMVEFFAESQSKLMIGLLDHVNSTEAFLFALTKHAQSMMLEVLCLGCMLRKKEHIATLYGELQKVSGLPLKKLVEHPEIIHMMQSKFPVSCSDANDIEGVVKLLKEIRDAK